MRIVTTNESPVQDTTERADHCRRPRISSMQDAIKLRGTSTSRASIDSPPKRLIRSRALRSSVLLALVTVAMSVGVGAAHADDAFGGRDYTNIFATGAPSAFSTQAELADPNAYYDSPARDAELLGRMQNDLNDIQTYGYFDFSDDYCYFYSTTDQQYEPYRLGSYNGWGQLDCS